MSCVPNVALGRCAHRGHEIGTDTLGEITIPTDQDLESDCSAPAPSGARTLCWTPGDNNADEWIPQGITTNSDGGGNSGVNRRMVSGSSTRD